MVAEQRTDVTIVDTALDVVVVGRANIDLGVRVPAMPVPGRTVFGSPLSQSPGGKACNQALAVAHQGGHAALVANLGADPWGHQIAGVLRDAGVDVTAVRLLPEARTGAALVAVTPDGENHIILALSPATELTTADIHHATGVLRAPVTVVQLDLPSAPIQALLSQPRNGIIVGNLVPHPGLGIGVLAGLDVFVVNEHEAAAILHQQPTSALHTARQLQELGPATVVVTAGPAGAAVASRDTTATIPAAPVPAVDTTGAGDTFLGVLALDLARGQDILPAVTAAVRAAIATVRYHGAQPSPVSAVSGPRDD